MLVRPFIQPISAFNANAQNGIANVCVLGGDIITTVNYQIYQSDTLIYSGSMSVTDNGGSAIRTFQIILTQSMGLVNNGSYTIRAWTVNATETSGYSSVALFYCYATPTITLKDTNNTTITSSYVFTAQSGTLNVDFAKNDNDSIATLNTFSMNIFGVDSNGNLNLVYSSGDVYTPFAVAYDNLTPTNTVSPLYASYQIKWTAETTQGMNLGGNILNMACNYTINESGDLISVENDRENGRIKVSFKSEFQYIGEMVSTPFGSSDISAVCQNGDKVYCGGSDGQFAIYDKTTNTFGSLVTNPFGGNQITAILADGTNVYVCGYGGKFAIYDTTTSAFGNAITTPFNSNPIMCMDMDSNYIYVGAGAVTPRFAIYDKATGTFGSLITNPFASGSFDAITVDARNVYCSASPYQFVVFSKSTQSFGSVITAPSAFYYIPDLANDENYVYCGGDGYIIKYNKKTNSFGSPIPLPFSYTVRIYSLKIDGNNLYCTGTSGAFVAYNLYTDTFGDKVNTAFGSSIIYGMDNDGGYLYFGGQSGKFAVLPKYMYIRKKNITSGESEYITLFELLTFDYSDSYLFYDYSSKNNTLYEYEIVFTKPSGTIQVEAVQVLSQFCKSYIADGNTAYELYEEWGVDNFQRNQKTAIYEPYGSKYPFVAYNSITNYDSGSDTAIYRAPTNVGQQYLDSIAQAKYNKQLRDFLTNRKVKVRKTESGDIALVATLNAVPNTYYKEMGNTLATTQFEWVEVGDFTDEDFKKLGITNGFTLYAQ